jgi:hypothetical protein
MVLPVQKLGGKHFHLEINHNTNGTTSYYKNKCGFLGCPHVKVTAGGMVIFALLDSGAEISVLSKSCSIV